ncbi:MAG TPA: hypothetical protein VI759_05525 [Dehalococcoidia bacterium]|nr:hypothetical protein [Dehalococcoidia bacterium]
MSATAATPKTSPTPDSQPLKLTPVDPSAVLQGVYIYDTATGHTITPQDADYYTAWIAIETLPTSVLEGGGRAIFDAASRSWLRLDLAGALNITLSDDRKRGAVQLENNGGLRLLDFVAKTYRDLGVIGHPTAFSPDGSHLLLSNPPASFSVLLLSRSSQPVPLPSKGRPQVARWLDNNHVLIASEGDFLQIFDVSGATPNLAVDETIAGPEHALSTDGTHLAAQARQPDFGVFLYRLAPFQQLASIPGAVIGTQYSIASRIWSADNRRVLLVLDRCGASERLVSYGVNDGSQLLLARGGFFEHIFSPDGRWVAFTTQATNGYLVPSDASLAPRLVSDNVGATSTPKWSADSRYVAFARLVGGYDRCIP